MNSVDQYTEHEESSGETKTAGHIVIVTRANYMFHAGDISLAPTIGFDFIGETKVNLAFGLTVGYGF